MDRCIYDMWAERDAKLKLLKFMDFDTNAEEIAYKFELSTNQISMECIIDKCKQKINKENHLEVIKTVFEGKKEGHFRFLEWLHYERVLDIKITDILKKYSCYLGFYGCKYGQCDKNKYYMLSDGTLLKLVLRNNSIDLSIDLIPLNSKNDLPKFLDKN